MIYCQTHQRALVPAPFDTHTGTRKPDEWHTVSARTAKVALAWAAQCGQTIVVYLEPCDWCQRESQPETRPS